MRREENHGTGEVLAWEGLLEGREHIPDGLGLSTDRRGNWAWVD